MMFFKSAGNPGRAAPESTHAEEDMNQLALSNEQAAPEQRNEVYDFDTVKALPQF